MYRLARIVFVGLLALIAVGCQTSEIKGNNTWPGLIDGGPSGTTDTQYGTGHGDSIGGGGAAPALTQSRSESGK